MKTFDNAYDFIRTQDNPFDYFFKTEDDEYGRFMVINGEIKAFIISDEVLETVYSWDDITDIYKVPSNKEFFNDSYILASYRVWTKESSNYTFIGVSNLGITNPDKNYAIVWANSKELPIRYYDYSLSVPDNNKVIKNAAYYVMVPPIDNPYIIGMGLAKQFEVRKSAGKECYIIINANIKKIKDIHYLKEGDCQRYAVVEVC